MASKGDIYLGTLGNERLLPASGRTLTIKDTELSREERTASGRLVRDVIATKKEITLEYSLIDGDELTNLLDIYDLSDELSLLIYHTDDGPTTTTGGPNSHCDAYTVLMKPLDRTRVLLTGEGLWSGVSVELEEV